MTKITENIIETFCIELLKKQGYEYLCTLKSLRDTLLPKLMSGEVRVQYDKEANIE